MRHNVKRRYRTFGKKKYIYIEFLSDSSIDAAATNKFTMIRFTMIGVTLIGFTVIGFTMIRFCFY